MDFLDDAAEQFTARGDIVEIREHGNGNINDTFLVSLAAQEERHFILQRLNPMVFPQPALMMANMRIFTEHVGQRLQTFTVETGRRWELPRLLSALDGRDYWLDAAGFFWRAISFIEAAQSFETVIDIKHANEIGRALGSFHWLLADLPVEQLADTLPGFHITPQYLNHYIKVLARHGAVENPEVNYCIAFVKERVDLAQILERARDQGKLILRAIHGDPKVNNIMIDTASGKAVSMVDLDTVKPGLLLYDIGDCLRSGCNSRGEEAAPLDSIRFDTEICQAILHGYVAMAGRLLTENDYEYLYDAIRLLAFELGLRYFSDYLSGNVYFKVSSPEQNLGRALVQFRLTKSIEAQEDAILDIIRELRAKAGQLTSGGSCQGD